MRILTPELVAHSEADASISAGFQGQESRELDFDLSRRTAIIINGCEAQIYTCQLAEVECMVVVNELDLDPDNTDIMGGAPATFEDVIDSTRLLRQVAAIADNTTNGLAHDVGGFQYRLDFTNRRIGERPITHSNIRHHIHSFAGGTVTVECFGFLTIRYQIVELTDAEMGLVAVLRRR